LRKRGEQLLKQMFGPEAQFREGQWEAIESVLQRRRTLVVQKTGWGKSIVYFLATKLLREEGAGPTILISPLLSLMRNQIDMAARIGIRAESINSTNPDEWEEIKGTLEQGKCDVLLISPERLANKEFLEKVLPVIEDGIGMFVVDEAHCISDWGHDFRPDYRRIVRILNLLPENVPVIATTATANNRVIRDIKEQLGDQLLISRGPLTRESLKLQSIKLADQAERLAWLAENVRVMAGSGIIYCLTVADCRRVAVWLRLNGIDALEYYGDLGNELREERERLLLNNGVKALVATVALGMGYDKPDLGYVIHYQRPGSLVAYYQQIGRAGRAVDDAYAILLNGREDDEIHEYFISGAFPGADEMIKVLGAIEASDGLSMHGIQKEINISQGRLSNCLKVLEIDGAVLKKDKKYIRSAKPWFPDTKRSEAVTELRKKELLQMQQFIVTSGCLMKYVADELNDPYAKECGRCANCLGRQFFSEQVAHSKIIEAIEFLRKDFLAIEPRKKWPTGGVGEIKGKIPEEFQMQRGIALCAYGDAGWGRFVRDDKYENGFFRDELVDAAVSLIKEKWQPVPFLKWVTAVPSLRRPALVPEFAKRVAERLGLPFHPILEKIKDKPAQKSMKNSIQQAQNVYDAFMVSGDLPDGPVLLVDDMVDSRWTFTVCSRMLLMRGSGPVFPFALASTAGGGEGN